MLISVKVHLLYSAPAPCDLLLQIEAAEGEDQTWSGTSLEVTQGVSLRSVSGEEQIGRRRWLRIQNLFECRYETDVQIHRALVALETLDATPPPSLPDNVTKYLMPSRYCYPEELAGFALEQFGSLHGGTLIAAMSDWIGKHFTYDNGASDASTTATDSFNKRAGVCRDYAHVLITMARAVGIPARYVSAYGPAVDPMDIHALVEVFLDGAWHLVDPTGMTKGPELVRIGVGRDAADVSFMTSFGLLELKNQSIQVELRAE